MLNLLLISDNQKAEHIKNELQPLLKVMIDVVTDFDRGMRDVFEKRPATVCIQDHIGAVSGESVARHIQMLLGSAAPTFILFHTGSGKARVINGLFEHLVDLSLSHDAVLEKLLATLKLLFGNQWERVYIPPVKTLDQTAMASTVLPSVQSEATPIPEQSLPLTSTQAPPAEAFRISRDTSPIDEPIPENLLFTFEENYRSRSLFNRRSYFIALAFVVSAAGGWFLFTQKPQMVHALKQRLLPAPVVKQAPVPVATAIPEQKPAQLPAPSVAAPVLPSFIPKDGLDGTFAQKNPGWNRFVGEKFEFRVFSAPGRIEAIQVLSIHSSIPESLITSFLQEFTGSPEYKILSRSTKDGVRVESGKVQDKGEIKLYRKNGSVKAFVVSVN